MNYKNYFNTFINYTYLLQTSHKIEPFFIFSSIELIIFKIFAGTVFG